MNGEFSFCHMRQGETAGYIAKQNLKCKHFFSMEGVFIGENGRNYGSVKFV
jgi:hypothetical protein